MWECGVCCCFVVFSSSGEQSEAINHRSEAINQQKPCRAMALGSFVKCPLCLPFASGLRRSSTTFGVTCPLWGLSLAPKYLLIAFGTCVFVQEVWPLDPLEFWAFPVNTDSLTYFWKKTKNKQLVSLPVCVACPSKSSSKLVLAFSSISVAGVGDAASPKGRTVNNRIAKGVSLQQVQHSV